MLGVVGTNILRKMVKFLTQHFWILQDVVVVWPGLYNNVAPGHAHSFDFQLAACCNTSQQGGQTHTTLSDLSRPTMLRYVAIVWTGLPNTGPTML